MWQIGKEEQSWARGWKGGKEVEKLKESGEEKWSKRKQISVLIG